MEGRDRAGVISNAEHIKQSRERPDIESGGIVEAAPTAISVGSPEKSPASQEIRPETRKIAR